MYEEINEQIVVVAVFKNGRCLPYSFDWQGRRYKVDQINLEHQERRGDDLLFYFSVTSGGNSYELSFDSRHLVWSLDRIWTE